VPRIAQGYRPRTAKLKGLPPALIQTAEFAVLCDRGEAYARKLDTAVTITISRYNDKTHDGGMLNPLAVV
jgi:acetyl esterase/lipase